MKKIIKTIVITSAIVSGSAMASPSATECEITGAIESPVATFLKIPAIFAQPYTAFLFAGSSYRNSLCPKEEYVTKEEYNQLRDELEAIKASINK